MGTPIMGRNARVKLGTYTILNLASWDMNFPTDELDASVFGTSWGATMPGMQKWTCAVAGLYDRSDTTGQKALMDAKINGTKLTTIRFYLDNTSYLVPDITNDSDAGAYITGMTVRTDKSGLAQVTFNAAGVGPIAFV
jgi:hypothetical protein